MDKFELFRQRLFIEIEAKNSWGKNELKQLFYELFYIVSIGKDVNGIKTSYEGFKEPLRPIPNKPATFEIADMLKNMNNMLTPSDMKIINHTQKEVGKLIEYLDHEIEYLDHEITKEQDFDKADNEDHDYVPWL